MTTTQNGKGEHMATEPTNGAVPTGAVPTEALEALQERLAPQLEQAAEQLAEVNERVKAFITKNPGTVLLGAAAVGFLIGRWAARR
jgi:ElaB/YqjD/DUF883 family membrane-anchored ribosome-binding protein